MTDPIVLYDADCGFCRWCMGRLLAWDRAQRLRVVALQEPDAAVLLAGISEDDRMASWHLTHPGDRIAYSGGDAFAPLLDVLPAGRPLALVARAFPGLTRSAYGWVARHRGAFGKLITRAARDRADRRIRERTAEIAYNPESIRPVLAIGV